VVAVVVLVVLVAAAVVAVVVSSSGDDDVALTESQLEGALLTADDVGDGFTVDTEDDDDDDDFDRDEVEASEECLDLYERFEEAEASRDETEVEVEIKLDGEDGSQVEQDLGQDPSANLDEVRELAETCPEISVDDGEFVGTIEFEVVEDVVELGDESLTLRLDVDLDEPYDLTVPSLVVVWERDGTQATVSISGAVSGETLEEISVEAPDEDLLRDVVTRADEKLAEVIAEA
jgi:hypothetical protein